jgi:NADH-quinone oxidoreductase subunit C
MRIDWILEALCAALELEKLDARTVPVDETFVTVRPEQISAAAGVLVERFGIHHLSTITGEDTGEELVLLYHFWDGSGLTLRTVLPRENASIATLTDLFPGATFYEREVGEMLGVMFEGYAGPAALLLPDDWDEEPPLRRTKPGDGLPALDATKRPSVDPPNDSQE